MGWHARIASALYHTGNFLRPLTIRLTDAYLVQTVNLLFNRIERERLRLVFARALGILDSLHHGV